MQGAFLAQTGSGFKQASDVVQSFTGSRKKKTVPNHLLKLGECKWTGGISINPFNLYLFGNH